jgi:hypothetical protein
LWNHRWGRYIVALLDVHPEFCLACDIPGAITKIDSAGGQRVKLSSCVSCTEIYECISSEVVSRNIELGGSGEEIEVTLFILMAADVQWGNAMWKVGPDCTKCHDHIVIGLGVRT